MIQRPLIAAALATALAIAPSICLPAPGAPAQTVDVAGVKFDSTIQLGGSPLLLNGYGVRYKAIFKVYAAGLYLATPAGTPDAVIGAPGAKRIHLVMLRNLDSNEFGKILAAGIEKNSTREEFIKSLPGILRMGEAAASHRVLRPGDTMTVDWVPGVGTTLYVKGKAEVGPIKDPGFFSAMIKIWLGRSPADALLKDALLGQTGSPANDLFN
jgi:hypothetical protein